jgi:hypothetical protein
LNNPFIERYVRAGGVWNGTETTFQESARANKFLNLLKPGTNRFDNAFQNAGNVAALENFKAMVGVGDFLGTKKFSEIARRSFGPIGETTDEVAASIASKMIGRLSTRGLGVGATQREVERLLAFAPRFYRSVFGLLGDAAQGGLRGNEARRVLVGLIGGSLALYTGAAWALGQKPKMDPFKSDWATLRIAGQNIGFGGPMHGLIRMGAESVQNPEKLDEFNMENPALRWARGRASPVVGLAADIFSKRSYLGDPLESPEQILGHVATTALPFGAQTLIREGPVAAAAQFVGARSFPPSGSQQLREEYEAKFGAGSWESTPSVVRSQNIREDETLQGLSQASTDEQVRRGDAYSQGVQEINARVEERVRGSAAGVARGDPQAYAAYARDRKDALTEGRAKKDQLASAQGIEFPDREANERVDTYFELEPTDQDGDGFVDDDDMRAFFDERDRLFKQMTPEERAAVRDPARRFTDPQVIEAERQYLQATDAREQFFNIPKYAESSLKEGEEIEDYLAKAREFQQRQRNLGRSLELRKAIKAYARETGTTEMARKVIRALKTGTNPQRQAFLIENPSLFLFFPDDFRPSLTTFESVSPEVAEQLIGVR